MPSAAPAVSDSEIDKACDHVMRTQGIDRRDVLAGLVFGSRGARHEAKAHDVDLIFFVSESARHPSFSYRQLHDGASPIDLNIIKPSFLNELCQRDVDWSYRLYRAQPIRGLGAESDRALLVWLEQINRLVESPPACRHRALLQIRDARFLVRGVYQLSGVEPGLAKCLLVEAFFLLPQIFLNVCGLVPFATGHPWDEAVRLTEQSDVALSKDYKNLMHRILASATLGACSPEFFSRRLKDLRESCVRIIRHHHGDIFRRGYGGKLAEALCADKAMASEITQQMSQASESAFSLLPEIWLWLNAARSAHHAMEPRRVKLRRKRDRTPGIRYIEYNSTLQVLKAIIPTGGCRVPTCTFCMLPSLARPKMKIEDVVSSLGEAGRNRPINRLSIYTDGSFFDDRELLRDERRQLANTARELEAKELLVESLPRFLTDSAIEDVKLGIGASCQLRIAIGLQSSNALIRRYITSTPIDQDELGALLRWRKSGRFALRIYLLANKPLLTMSEDRADLHDSLQFLDRWLGPDDIVTVNPLLPTSSTVLDRLTSRGFWRALSVTAANDLEVELRSSFYGFRLEFGPATASTCNDVDLQQANDTFWPATASLPWSILGSARSRGQWATGQLA